MVRHHALQRCKRLFAVVLALALGAATDAGAQSLAEAARKAEEQRKAAAGESLKIDKLPAPPEDDEPRLDAELLYRYSETRTWLARLRRSDPALQARLLAAAKEVQLYDDYEQVLASEPAVVALLAFFRFTPRVYTRIEILVLTLKDRGDKMSTLPEYLTHRQIENATFGVEHYAWVMWVVRRAGQEEKGLQSWPGRTPTYRGFGGGLP